jgi:TctA family transporter
MMQIENKKTKFLLSFGIVLFLMALFSTDLNDFSFEHNSKSYFKITISGILLFIAFYRMQKEKREKTKI